MKRFRFSLQTVHDLREERRDVAEAELARAAAELRQARKQLEAVKRARAIAEENYFVQLAPGALDPRDMEFRVAYLRALDARERDALVRIVQIERRHEEQRRATAEAARDAEATSSLRDRQRARHNEEAARVAQNALDEMATLAAARLLVSES